MAKTKYKECYDLMLAKNEQLFADFQKVHDAYKVDPEKNATKFHKEGRDVLDVIRSFERRLCSGMERTNHSVYSNKVAEKFWDEVRRDLPLIDQVGVVIKNRCI